MNQMLSTAFSGYNLQQTAYLLPLPKDVADVILSFVFYDKKTSEARKVHRLFMTDIVYRFANAIDSRATIHGWNNPDTDEHWGISFRNFKEEHLQLQAINCRFCGEYMRITDYNLIIPIPCRCLHEPYHQYDDDNDYYSEDSAEDDDDEYDHLW
jgi:hypothetical protein